MSKLWLLKGAHEAPGWKALKEDHQEERIDIAHLDPLIWALVEADEPPGGYEGLSASEPADGLYVDPNGNPLYVVGCKIADGAAEVVAALGGPAEEMLEKLGDPDLVLERLGRTY